MPKTICAVTARKSLCGGEPVDIGVLILAGGEATRLPSKLERAAGSLPMIARVYRNVSAGRTTFISCKGTFAPAVDALLPCPMVIDRWARRGPLAGLVSTMREMANHAIFAVAGDAPFVTSAFIDRLARHLRPGVQAIVPRHNGRLEPLAAIYDRSAFLRVAEPLLHAGQASVQLVIAGLAATYVSVEDDARIFANINTPADYATLQNALLDHPDHSAIREVSTT